MNHARPFVLLFLIGWLTFSASPSVVSTAPPPPESIDVSLLRKIEPQILKQLRAAKDGKASFIVQFRGKPDLSAVGQKADRAVRRSDIVRFLQSSAETSQRAALNELERRKQAGAVEAYNSLWIINGASVRSDRETLLALAARPEVEAIRADRRRYLSLPVEAPREQMLEVPTDAQVTAAGVEWNISKVRADLVWSALGIDGTGAVVATMDTGVYWQHQWLIDKYRGYSSKGPVNHTGNWYDFTPEAYPVPFDGHGHGTHVTGIMVGSDSSNDVGVAPGAKWIAAKVFAGGSSPYADDSWIHAAFQWILAPAGDPGLAPDIVNCSWGSPDATDQVFKPDVEMLLASGIVPVFSAGNNGPSPASINSPGSLDSAFSVGATDSSDYIAGFSSRGPSPSGKIKPEVSAPGVSIRSSYPGGLSANMSGTSMATPHVAGLLALLKQASPAMTPLQALGVITSTAVPLGAGHPNNNFGWGRIDAYAAVSQAMQAGVLMGVVSSSDGKLIPGATITATSQATGALATTSTGVNGGYSMALGPGMYDVKAGAFGYAESPVYRVVIDVQGITTRNLALDQVPTGFITGIVTEVGTGLPLMATIVIAGTPVRVQTEPSTGYFTVAVPSGIYAIKATSNRHRVRTESGVVVVTSAATTLNFSLLTAPSILVVDSGVWYSGSGVGYYTSALDRLDYVYSVRPISDTALIPTLAELAPYDILIWSSPLDSPGYIGADAALAQYLDGGGKLLLTGQDVGYYDGGGAAFTYAPYYRDHLHATYISDNSGIRDLVGNGIFAGITLTLNTSDSARNQLFPDVVAAEGNQTTNVMSYAGDGVGGIETDVCLPYRAVYLGFGLEGAGPADSRVALLDRTLEWLVVAPPAREIRILPSTQDKIKEPGKVDTSTIVVWNTGTSADNFAASANGDGWSSSLWDESFVYPVSQTGQIMSCQSITLGVKTGVPAGLGNNVGKAVSITLQSLSEPALHATATVNVKTPAFILLVDGDRWYDVESYYKHALAALGYAYDFYDTRGGAGPGISTLSMYSITIWFTGYDWYQPLTTQDEANLAAYLDGGGRLFLSSQDYLYVHGLDDFGSNFLGILAYTNDVTATRITGVAGDILGDGLGPYTLTMPYDGFKDWSDEVIPKSPAGASLLDIHGGSTGIANLDGGGRGRTVFFAFPFEGLDTEPAKQVLDRIIERALSTDLKPDRRVIGSGDQLRYELSISNPGSFTAGWVVTSPMPADTAFVPESLEGDCTYDAAGNRIFCQAVIAPGGTARIAYRVSQQETSGQSITGKATFDRVGRGSFVRTATTSVGSLVFLPMVSKHYSGAGW